MKEKVSKLLEMSIHVLKDCCLENGAIVAANTDKNYYCKDVFSYRYVWPRDAAFTLVAFDILGIEGYHEKYYNWILNRAEDFDKTNLLFQNYHSHGLKNWTNLQPDSNGLTLWSIFHHQKIKKPNELLVTKLAEGLCSIWNDNKFLVNTQDPWEERIAYPEFNEFHIYSVATASLGLKLANKMFPNKRWQNIASKMNFLITNSFDNDLNFFPRTCSDIKSNVNYCIDASLLSLIFPANILDLSDVRMMNTYKEIESKLKENGGLKRYQFDFYDGMVKNNLPLKIGAGRWPLLNFWASICLSKNDYKEEAFKYYNWVIDSVENYIPEQIFQNNFQKSISPLAWSHSMFIIASSELNLI